MREVGEVVQAALNGPFHCSYETIALRDGSRSSVWFPTRLIHDMLPAQQTLYMISRGTIQKLLSLGFASRRKQVSTGQRTPFAAWHKVP